MLLGLRPRQDAGGSTPAGRKARPHGRKLATGAIGLGAGLSVLLALPLTSLGSGNPGLNVSGTVTGVLNSVPQVTHVVQSTVQQIVTPQSSGSSSGASSSSSTAGPSSAAAPRASSSTNTPAMYGSDSHGQGTVAGVSLTPSSNVPYPYAPGGSGGEIAVVGRGRSEQGSDGTAHAHTTILALLGQEILGVDATPGQSNTGPLDAVQKGILNSLCTGTGMFACITVLAADTSATSTGANTHFSAAHATIGGAHGIDAGAAESNSAINTTSNCQTASGNSSAAGVNIAGGPLATVGQSSESSSACANQAPSQKASSSVVGLGGQGLPVPAPGCDNGTPNTTLNVAGLLTAICNAENTTELVAPSGVREALTAIVLPAVGTALAKTVVAASESHAVAPSTGTGGGGGGGTGGGGGGGTGGGGGGGTGGNGGNGGTGGGNGGSGSGNGGSTSGQSTTTCPASDPDCAPGSESSEGGAVSGASTGAGEGNEGANEGSEGTTHAVNAASTGGLPFTGEDLLKVVLVGLLLAGGGLAISLRARRQS